METTITLDGLTCLITLDYDQHRKMWDAAVFQDDANASDLDNAIGIASGRTRIDAIADAARFMASFVYDTNDDGGI